MSSEPKEQELAAQAFIGTTARLKLLGSGVGGIVFLAPDGRSAIKVYHNGAGYATEVEAYKRLRAGRVKEVCGFNVPTLRATRPDVPLIQMDVVFPPFLLDFAGVHFEPPDFPDNVMEDTRQKTLSRYGEYISIVDDVYAALTKFDIYYLDFHPGNLKMDGLPGYQPSTEADIDNEPY